MLLIPDVPNSPGWRGLEFRRAHHINVLISMLSVSFNWDKGWLPALQKYYWHFESV